MTTPEETVHIHDVETGEITTRPETETERAERQTATLSLEHWINDHKE
jgi:hypothetical protein